MLSTKQNQSKRTDIQVGIASSRLELFSAFELVYHAYLRTGLVEENPYQMRVTGYQTLRTTDVLIAKETDRIACTVSVVRDGALGLPMAALYQEQVDERREMGISLAEVSCLAHDSERDGSFPMVVKLMSLVAQLAKARDVDQLLIAVHPRHSRFYSRFLGFEVIGAEKSYDVVKDNPAVAMMLDLNRLVVSHPRGYKTLFGNPLPSETLRHREIPLSLADEIQFLAAETTDFQYKTMTAAV